MRKKAITLTANTVGKWLLALVLLVVLLFIAKNIAEIGEIKGEGVLRCRSSIGLMANSSRGLLGLIEGKVPFECETNWVGNLTIKEKDEEKQKEEALDQIVPLMRDCWFQFGEGEWHPFKGSEWTNPRICFICSQFSLPENFEAGITEADMEKYLHENDDSYSKERYEIFFENAFPENSMLIEEADVLVVPFWLSKETKSLNEMNKSVSKDYAIVYWSIYSKQLTEARIKIIGSEALYQTTFIVPFNKTKDLSCTELKKIERTTA